MNRILKKFLQRGVDLSPVELNSVRIIQIIFVPQKGHRFLDGQG